MQSHSDEEQRVDEEKYNGDSLMSHVCDFWFTSCEHFTVLAALESSVCSFVSRTHTKKLTCT